MRRYLGFWWSSLKAGGTWVVKVGTVWQSIAAILALAGISVVIKISHAQTWVVVLMIALIVLAIFGHGAYLMWDKAERKGAGAPSAAFTTSSASSIDRHDWTARVDVSDAILFILEHREANPGAILGLSDFQCEVIEPNGKRSVGKARHNGSLLVAQYDSAIFPGAPPATSGKYRYSWSAKDAHGQRHQLAHGDWHVDAPHHIPQNQFASEGAGIGFEVFIVDEKWRPYQFKALFVESKLKITNHAAQVKTIGRIATLLHPEPGTDIAQTTDIEVSREGHRLEREHNPLPHTFEPGQTVHHWHVVTIPHQPHGGEPQYEIIIEDEHRHQYGVKRLARPK